MSDIRRAEYIKADCPQPVERFRAADYGPASWTKSELVGLERAMRNTATPYLCPMELTGSPTETRMGVRGGREFSVDERGQPSYRTRPGDTLYGISRDYLAAKNGRAPSQSEVDQFASRIAKENGIKNKDRIGTGVDLRMPDRVGAPKEDFKPHDERYDIGRKLEPYGPGSWRPGVAPPEKTPSNPFVQPQGTEQGTSKDTLNRKVTSSEKDTDGNRVTKYEGELRDGIMGGFLQDSILDIGQGRTKFKAEDKTDSQGRLLERKITYSNQDWFGNGGIDMKIPDPKGGEMKVEVKQMEIKYNPKTGNYDTTLIDAKGRRYEVQTDRNGKPIAR